MFYMIEFVAYCKQIYVRWDERLYEKSKYKNDFWTKVCFLSVSLETKVM